MQMSLLHHNRIDAVQPSCLKGGPWLVLTKENFVDLKVGPVEGHAAMHGCSTGDQQCESRSHISDVFSHRSGGLYKLYWLFSKAKESLSQLDTPVSIFHPYQ